jgi:DNA-3-methyladenine glycosylase II
MPKSPALVATLAATDLAAACAELAERDATLGRLIARVGPFGLEPRYRAEPYDGLFRAIVYQQLSGKAAGTILGRVLALFGDGRVPPPRHLLAMPEERLRGAGLSRNKTRALRDLAERTLDGTVPAGAAARRTGDEELIARLSTVKGVGRWTAEMLLIAMGRPDILPVADLGVRKGYGLTFRSRDLPPAERILRRGERWRPYRTIVSWYLWRAVDTPAG